MDLLRLVPRRYFEQHLGRFSSLSFSEQDGGISVVAVSCARERSVSLCEHIYRYYPSFADRPPIFLRFVTDSPPASAEVVQEDSTTGDICHYNIRGIPKGKAKEWWRKHAPDIGPLETCDPDGSIRHLRMEDI